MKDMIKHRMQFPLTKKALKLIREQHGADPMISMLVDEVQALRTLIEEARWNGQVQE